MSKIKTAVKLLKTPVKLIPPLARCGLLNWLPDETVLKLMYKARIGKTLNLEEPRSFSEKLQWLKLYDRDPLYIKLVDKYEVRKHIAETIGEEYLIPIHGVWDDPNEIDFDSLPDQFVLKCTHDSGSVIICDDKSEFDRNRAKKKLKKAQKFNFYYHGREWPYKNVQPRIIAEEFLSDGKHEDIWDYKFFCFSGVPMYCQVIGGRNSLKTMNFFDMNWCPQEARRVSNDGKAYPFTKEEIPRPATFDEMKAAAERLSKDIPFSRVDFYEVQGKMYFGEITFYPASGFCTFEPEEWNDIFGSWINLPPKR